MMLKETLSRDLREQMKSRNEVAVRAIRLLQTELRYREIAVTRELSPEEEIQCVRSCLKKYRESIDQFRSGGREDLVLKEEDEAKIIEKYLPEQLAEEEILPIIDTVIEEFQAGPGDFGTVMKEVMIRVAGKADGAAVNRLVRSRLR